MDEEPPIENHRGFIMKSQKKIIIAVIAGVVLFVAYRLFFSAPEIRNANPVGEDIVCFGDSLTYGTGASEDMDYPSQLSDMVSMSVINAGVPGDTTATALARLEDDVLSESPRIVLITLGGNDLKNKVSKEKAFGNLRTIVTSIQDEGALVIVAGINIPFYGRGFGKAYKELCNEVGAVLIPNIFKGIMGNPKLMSDPIHPNDDGYAIMAKKFYEAMKPYL
jgi:acyl-CoA thioesterase-1